MEQVPRFEQVLCNLVALILCIGWHEAAHAWAASLCGDPTARLAGRVSLNPLRHIDLLGTVILPLLMLLSPGRGFSLIGWGKPCPVNPAYFRKPVRDFALVAAAGPLSNLVLLVLAAVAAQRVEQAGFSNLHVLQLLNAFIMINLVLFVFNLLPIPPLDGSRLLRAALPADARDLFDSMERYGFIILLVFINTPAYGWCFRTLAVPVFAFLKLILWLDSPTHAP